MISVLGSCSGGGGGTIVPTGTATLTWNTPTLNNDGSALTDLAGFKIHYGTASVTYTSTIDVAGPSVTAYTVQGLQAGSTYYFMVTAYITSGVESIPSVEVSKTL